MWSLWAYFLYRQVTSHVRKPFPSHQNRKVGPWTYSKPEMFLAITDSPILAHESLVSPLSYQWNHGRMWTILFYYEGHINQTDMHINNCTAGWPLRYYESWNDKSSINSESQTISWWLNHLQQNLQLLQQMNYRGWAVVYHSKKSSAGKEEVLCLWDTQQDQRVSLPQPDVLFILGCGIINGLHYATDDAALWYRWNVSLLCKTQLLPQNCVLIDKNSDTC